MRFRKTLRNVEKEQARDAGAMDRLAANLLTNPRAARAAAKKLKKQGYSYEQVREEWERIGVKEEITQGVQEVWH